VAPVTGSRRDGDVGRRRNGLSECEGDRVVLEPERQQLTGYSRAWWFQLERKGTVPKRIRLGDRKVGWLHSELMAWLRERAAARDAEGAGGADASAA
jgi:prophage regulatory protein